MSIPWFEIFLSNLSDGDFHDQDIHPEILRPISQLHGIEIHELTSENLRDPFTDCDGVYTRLPDISIWALTADCPIIILMGEGECAAIHSGWRGTQSHIVQYGIDRFSTPCENIRAFIWAHISHESYIVWDDFREHFPRQYFSEGGGKLTFNLEQYIIDDMLASWILRDHITCDHIDTYADTKYHSYRRDPSTWVGCISVRMDR